MGSHGRWTEECDHRPHDPGRGLRVGGRQYQVDRGAVARCLQGNARSIEYDFDGACADSRTAGMQALNRIFKEYIWSCAG